MADIIRWLPSALDLHWWQLIAAIGAALAGGIISGLTGFGFGLVIVPVLLMLFPPASVVVLSKGLGAASGVPILVSDWRDVRFRTIATMFVPAVCGLVIGTAILTHADPALIKLIAGVAVTLFAVIIGRGFVIPGIHSRIAPLVAGLASGTLGTSTGMPGPPAVMYLTHHDLPPRTFRVSIVGYFIAVDAIGVALVARAGKVGLHEFWIALVLLPFALIGRRMGQRLIAVVDREQFRQITLRLLILTGASAIATALFGFR
jgi:uncharacterized membrane protein YfcA